MGFDPGKIQGGTPQQVDPGKGNGKGFDPGKIASGQADPVLGGAVNNISFDDYRFQPKTNADNDKLRAQDQGWGEQLAIKLGNLVPNVAGGVFENLGYLGSLTSEWGDDRDYNNWLTQFGNSMKNPFGTIYRENPDKVWDPSDSAWWYDAFGSLVESAASFAIEGAGIAKVFKSITDLARLTKFAGLAKGAAELGTSALMAYTEGAQMGAQVYDKTYQEQYNKLRHEEGWDANTAHDKAKHIAANAAATTVQLNTLINTGLNLPQLAPLFMGEDDIMKWWKTAGMRQEGEAYEAFAKRIKTMNPLEESGLKKFIDPRHAGLTHLATGAASEGLEEVVNDWAQYSGENVGKKRKEKGNLWQTLTTADNFFDDVMNEQGALDFVLGAVGGLAQDALIDRIPIHRRAVDENGNLSTHQFDGADESNGKYKTKLVSAHYLTSTGHRQFFDNVKDKVVSDINRIDEMKTKLAEATAKGDNLAAEKIKRDFFNAGALYSVQLGMGDSFAAQFKNIEQLDNTKSLHEAYVPQIQQLNQAIDQETDEVRKKELIQQRDKATEEMNKLVGVTEAMQKGFAKNDKDNAYKEKAQEAQADIDHYTKMWDEIHKQYRFGDEWDSRYADYLFGREIDQHTRGKIIKDEDLRIKEMEARRNEAMHPDEDPVTTQAISDVDSNEYSHNELKTEEASIRRALSQVASDNVAEQAKGKETLKNIAEKYSVTNGDDDLVKGAHQVLGHIKTRLEEYTDKSYDSIRAIAASEKAQAWMAKNPGKDIVDYIKALRRKTKEDDGIQSAKNRLNSYKEQTLIARKNLDELRAGKGRAAYIAGAKKLHNAMVKTMKEKIDKSNAAAMDEFYSKKNVADLTKLQKKEYISILTNKIERNKAELEKAKADRSEAAKKLGELNHAGLIERMKNKLQVYKLSREIDKLSALIKSLQNTQEQLEQQKRAVTEADDADTTVLPPQSTDDEAQLKASDQESVEAWFGNIKAFDQMMNEIWALRPGPLDEVLDAAEDIAGRKLDALDHPILYTEVADRTASIKNLRTFLEAELRKAGKVQEEEEVEDEENDTPEANLISTIQSFNMPQEKAAELLTVLDNLEEDLNDAQQSSEIMQEIKKTYDLSDEQIQALREAMALNAKARKSDKEKVVESINDGPTESTKDGEGSLIRFSQRGQTTIMYDSEKGRFVYHNKEGKELTPKQSLRIANRITKNYFKAWYREMATEQQKQQLENYDKEVAYILRQAHYADHVDTLKLFLMRMIKGVRFTPVIMKDLTDVSAKRWSAEKEAGGAPLDTFVSDYLGVGSEESLLDQEGFTGYDEQDIMNEIKAIIQQYPKGITAKHIKEEERANSTIAQLEDLDYQFLHESGLSLSEALKLYPDVKAEEKQAQESGEHKDNGEAEVGSDSAEGDDGFKPDVTNTPTGPGPTSNKGQSIQLDMFAASQMDGAAHGGMKTESAIKANVLTHEYMDTVIDGIYDKEDTHSLNPHLNPLWVKPGYFKQGDQLMLVVDKNYKGTINDDGNYTPGGPNQRADEFGFYSDSDGKVDLSDDEKVGNVPIKIVDPRSGTIVGYLPRTDWVTAKYPGVASDDFRNVVDTKHDAEGNVIYKDNVAKQKAALLELRRHLVDAHNKGYENGLPTAITSRARGIALRVDPERTTVLLPDTSLRLAMMQGTTVRTADGVAEEAVIPGYLAGSDAYNNVPGILIPDAAGRMNFEPLWSDKIEQGEIDTVLKVLELYLGAGTEHENAEQLDQIQEATGFDVRTPEGVEAWLNQYYYYTQAFEDTDIMANKAIMGARVPDFKIAIAKNPVLGERKGYVKAGMTYLGKLAYASLDANGKLNQDFVELMTAGLSSRFKNVVFSKPHLGIRGINSTGPITEVMYHPNTDSFSTKEHASYNDRVKAFTKTTMEGRLKSSDGTYVYYAHPNTQLDNQMTLSQEIFERKPKPTKKTEPVVEIKPTEKVSDEELDDIFGGMDTELGSKPRLTTPSNQIQSTVGTLVGQPVTLDNLSKLRTFTPLENRNLLTPAEALANMKRLGISVITEGYNPFFEC